MQGGCARRVTGSDSGRHFSKIHKQFLYGNWENEKKTKDGTSDGTHNIFKALVCQTYAITRNILTQFYVHTCSM